MCGLLGLLQLSVIAAALASIGHGVPGRPQPGRRRNRSSAVAVFTIARPGSCSAARRRSVCPVAATTPVTRSAQPATRSSRIAPAQCTERTAGCRALARRLPQVGLLLVALLAAVPQQAAGEKGLGRADARCSKLELDCAPGRGSSGCCWSPHHPLLAAGACPRSRQGQGHARLCSHGQGRRRADGCAVQPGLQRRVHASAAEGLQRRALPDPGVC